MPRTTYSDFSLPNLQQDFQQQRRGPSKRKGQIIKKKSRNYVKPNRKNVRTSKKSFKQRSKYTGSYSPQHKIQIYDDDSASFQSDCIDNRHLDDLPVDRTEETLPFLDKECEDAINRLVEESERKQLIGIMQEFRLDDRESLMSE